MKRVLLQRHGVPEVLVDQEVTTPQQPGPGEVILQVFASGVNFADLLQRMGLYGSAPPLPYVPGFEVAGRVSEVGNSVQDFAAGDRVVGLTMQGGYAEEICLPRESLRIIPENLSYSQAAALPVNYLTAWFCLFSMGNLKKGDRLLIHGGAGGVGMAAIQLAQEHSVEIFTTVGSEQKRQFLEELGLQHVIDYRLTDFQEYVHTVTRGEGVEVILDGIGGKTLQKSYKSLAPFGRLVSYGFSSAAPAKRRSLSQLTKAWWDMPRFKPLEMIGRNVGVFGFHLALLGSKQFLVHQAFDDILDKASRSILVPVLAAEFPLSAQGAVEAHHFLHDRRNIGKVLLVRHEY